jgi:hypothetical protein
MVEIDARARTKEWIDLYIDTSHINKLDDITACQIHTAYGKPNYGLQHLFWGTINDDVEIAIQDPEVTPLIGFNKKAYGYIERVPLEVYTVDKGTTVSGLDAQWKTEQELRSIAENYPLGSVRTFQSMTPNSVNMGGWTLYSKRMVLQYKRAAGTAQTTAFVSYGNGFLDDCTDATLASWAETDAGNVCALTVSNDDIFVLTSAGGSAYYTASTGNLSSSLYTKIRIRWATSNTSVKAKVEVVFSDTSTQVVINDLSSVGYTVTEADITASKTITGVNIYAKTAAGIVYYDFVEIYKDDFVYPNITSIPESSFERRDANLDTPGYAGDPAQGLGNHSKQLQVTCDLDISNAYNDWLRPQGTLTKTGGDTVAGQVFHELIQDCTVKMWTWINLESYGAFKALIDIINEPSEGPEHTIILKVTEYRQGTAAGETEAQRFSRT